MVSMSVRCSAQCIIVYKTHPVSDAFFSSHIVFRSQMSNIQSTFKSYKIQTMAEENMTAENENTEEVTQENTQQDAGSAGDMSVEELQAKVKNLEEVTKKAQYDYVMLKYDFDSYQRRVEQDNKEGKSQVLIDIMKKLLPMIDQLSYSVDHMPEDLQGNKRADGVKLVYDNAVKTLASLGIEKIATMGQDPDSELHEPLSMEPTDDEAMKGKIIKEYEAGYTLKQGDTKKVIKAAKVIVGQ